MNPPKFQPGTAVKPIKDSNHPVKAPWRVDKLIPMPSGYVCRGFVPGSQNRPVYEHEVFLEAVLTKPTHS